MSLVNPKPWRALSLDSLFHDDDDEDDDDDDPTSCPRSSSFSSDSSSTACFDNPETENQPEQRSLSLPQSRSPHPLKVQRCQTFTCLDTGIYNIKASISNEQTTPEFRTQVQKRRSDPSLVFASLQRVSGLGAGQFGSVSLVSASSGCKYALKSMWKGQLLACSQAHSVVRERDLLHSVNHPFIARLEGAFQDERRIFMLIEPILGGELYAMLHVIGRLDETMAQFYTACVCEMLRHLHEKRIVYRDLKPENLLIDAHGYLKLIDFGIAKQLEEGPQSRVDRTPLTTLTICGTPEYMCPEMILGEAYTFSADWWAVGILLFEMVSGAPPFRGHSRAEVHSKIVNDPPRLVVPISRACSDTIIALLSKRPANRLGWDGILKASWLREFDFEALVSRRMPAPWVPHIAHDADTSNVLQLDKYISPADGQLGSEWDQYLTAARLDSSADPFSDFSCSSSVLHAM